MRRRKGPAVLRPVGRRRLVEWGKNLLIAVLVLSAVYLALRTGLYTNWFEGSGGLWGVVAELFQGPEDKAVTPADPTRPDAAARPVRMAVYGGEGRYGVQYDAALTDPLYDAFSGLLGEGLSSAQNLRTVTEQAWRAALRQPGVYFEFAGSMPLEALRSWLSERAEPSALTGGARRLLLALGEGDAVTLYYSNESDGMYYACDTAVSYVGHLQEALEGYTANGATFIFEYGPEAGYGALDPYVMVLSAPPSPRVYRGANPVNLESEGLLDTLQKVFSFPAQTSAVYQRSDSVVVRDGNDTLRVRADGMVTVHVGEEVPRYPVEGDDPAALIEACRALAQPTVGSWCGEARLSFSGLSQREDGGWEVRFSYLLDGAEVQLYDEGYAAWFLIRNGQITDITLRFRSYEDTGERSIVLRELQAAAAMSAISPQGRELALCYEDSGGELIRAGWVAR